MAVICGSMARSLGSMIRVGQLSMMAGAMVLCSSCASDWVAKMTLAFFFLSVTSHSPNCLEKAGSPSASQPSSTTIIVGRPSRRSAILWNR